MQIFRQAISQAAARRISMVRLAEDAIRRVRLPVSTVSGGLAPGFSTLEAAVAAADLAEDRRRAR